MFCENMKTEGSTRSALAARISISALIASDVDLVAAGDEWHGSCPFHDDGSVSLHVSDPVGGYVCFDCGIAGDAVDWIMHRDGVSESEALACIAAMRSGSSLNARSPTCDESLPVVSGRV